MTSETLDEELTDAAARYQRARSVLVAAERALSNSANDHLVMATHRASVELIAARTAMHRLLLDHGWKPPAAILDQLAVDELLLRTPTGADG